MPKQQLKVREDYIPPIRVYNQAHPRYEGQDAVSMIRHQRFAQRMKKLKAFGGEVRAAE